MIQHPARRSRRDHAAIIAQVLCEHPPAMMTTAHTVIWIRRTWPGCTEAEALRAIKIADELLDIDHATRNVG